MEQLRTTLASAETQYTTFTSRKTTVSGTRARSDLLKLQKQCGELRKVILAESKANKENRKAAKAKPDDNPDDNTPTVETPIVKETKTRKPRTKKK